MTVCLNGEEVAKKIGDKFPDSIAIADKATIIAESKSLYQIAEFLKNSPDYKFDYLANMVAIDYMDYFEVVYNLVSIEHNHSIALKARCNDRENPELPSVVSLWRTADYQEREIYDLMGITFTGHPNMKRLFLWEGFPGHPQRRDYL